MKVLISFLFLLALGHVDSRKSGSSSASSRSRRRPPPQSFSEGDYSEDELPPPQRVGAQTPERGGFPLPATTVMMTTTMMTTQMRTSPPRLHLHLHLLLGQTVVQTGLGPGHPPRPEAPSWPRTLPAPGAQLPPPRPASGPG